MMTLAELLKRKGNKAITVPESASLAEAIRVMHQNRVGSVLVPADGGKPVGIITERDILRLFAEGKNDFEKLLVKDCMTTHLIFGKPDDRIHEIMNIMTERRFRHLPVIQEGQIIGVVSMGDLVKAKLEETTVEAQALRQYISS